MVFQTISEYHYLSFVITYFTILDIFVTILFINTDNIQSG